MPAQSPTDDDWELRPNYYAMLCEGRGDERCIHSTSVSTKPLGTLFEPCIAISVCITQLTELVFIGSGRLGTAVCTVDGYSMAGLERGRWGSGEETVGNEKYPRGEMPPMDVSELRHVLVDRFSYTEALALCYFAWKNSTSAPRG